MQQAVFERLLDGQNLSGLEMQAVMAAIMGGEVSAERIAGFLVALRMKGETWEEVAAGAEVMRNKAAALPGQEQAGIDTCGTGGDGSGTFNISTAAAIVTAACGVPVFKHGNRSVSSLCGSADVLEALGVVVDLQPHQVADCARQTGISFLFAPVFHAAMRFVAPTRKALQVRTVFNMLGPLTNPARLKGQVLGVYRPDYTALFARALRQLGIQRALVVHGWGGVDELSLAGPSQVAEVRAGEIMEYELDPLDWGFPRADIGALRGGEPQQNAAMIRDVLSGQVGAPRDAVLVNSAAAIYVSETVDSFAAAVEAARDAIDSGRAARKLAEWAACTQELKSL